MKKWVGIYQDFDGTYGAFVEEADDCEEAEYLLHESTGGAPDLFCMELDEFREIAKAVLNREGE